jgi:hypothetical protein
MTGARILLFDSGMGGLTVATCVRAQLPNAHLIYAADNAGFPYGAWKEEALVARIVHVVGTLIEESKPDIVVIACNTASTLAMVALREKFKILLGTVPATACGGSDEIQHHRRHARYSEPRLHPYAHPYLCLSLQGDPIGPNAWQKSPEKLKGHARSDVLREDRPVSQAGRQANEWWCWAARTTRC